MNCIREPLPEFLCTLASMYMDAYPRAGTDTRLDLYLLVRIVIHALVLAFSKASLVIRLSGYPFLYSAIDSNREDSPVVRASH